MIEVSNLCKSFGNLDVLKDINLKINTGEIYGLVGRSGAGKSTLLRCINGLEKYDSGSLKIDGTELSSLNKLQMRELRKGIGMIFQQFSLIERRDVYQNVALPMKCWRYEKKAIDKRIHEILDLVDISDKIHSRPHALSGGQKQRVAIARALALDTHILLCDEATSALDPKTTQSVLNLLRQINQKLGLTIVVVTHQMEVVRDVCDTISILENGKIAVSGNVKNVFLQKPPALMDLLGKKKMTIEGSNEVVSFFVPSVRLNEMLMMCNQYHLDVVYTDTNEYKGESLTEIDVSISERQSSEFKDVLDQQKILWHSEKGRN